MLLPLVCSWTMENLCWVTEIAEIPNNFVWLLWWWCFRRSDWLVNVLTRLQNSIFAIFWHSTWSATNCTYCKLPFYSCPIGCLIEAPTETASGCGFDHPCLNLMSHNNNNNNEMLATLCMKLGANIWGAGWECYWLILYYFYEDKFVCYNVACKVLGLSRN